MVAVASQSSPREREGRGREHPERTGEENQLPISTPNLSVLGKIDQIARKYTQAYQSANLEVEGRGEERQSVPKQNIHNQRLEKSPSMRLRSRVARPRLRPEPPRTPPPRSPTPAPAAAAPLPAQGSAIRRGAAGRGPEWPRVGAHPRTAAGREPCRRQPRRPSSSPLLFQGLWISLLWSPAAASGNKRKEWQTLRDSPRALASHAPPPPLPTRGGLTLKLTSEW